MKELFKKYLFNKHILIEENEPDAEESFNTIVALKNKFGIKISEGMELAEKSMIKLAAEMLGEYVPEPFYRGFPQSVRELTADQLLFDQLYHYFQTYCLGNFDEKGYSMFEKNFDRLAFNEDVDEKIFRVLTLEKAYNELAKIVENLCASSRPLNGADYDVVAEYIRGTGSIPEKIACKQTVMKLMYDLKAPAMFIKFVTLPDVIKLVDYINYSEYNNENIKKLALKNADRRFISKVIDLCMEHVTVNNINECYEKRKIWCGLLHHIHYQPKNSTGKRFCEGMRSGDNYSVYSRTEKEIANGNIVQAAKIMSVTKGSSVVVRNLNYLLSRCKTEEEVKGVLSWVK